MALKILNIASGSHGNCTYIASETTKILVDAGVGIRKLTNALEIANTKITDINGIVITHEHNDHISGLPSLYAKGVPVYAHERACAAICRKAGGIAFENVDFYDGGFMIGDILVRPFRIPHDASYPLAYTFENNGTRISVATDIGHITDGLISNLLGSQLVVLEANHDLEMLIKGSYRSSLKKRIQGANGHLSNDSAGIVACNLAGHGIERLILGHLSEENNYPELAFSTVVQVLEREGIKEGKDIFIDIALQNKIGELIEVNNEKKL